MSWWQRSIGRAAHPHPAGKETSPAPGASTCWTTCDVGSIQPESSLAHESTEIGPLWHRILPDLVLRPAIAFAATEFLGMALGFVGLHRLAPSVVSFHFLAQARLVVAVAVDRDIETETRAHHPCERRPTHPESGDRKDMLRQRQNRRDLGRTIAD